MIVMCIPVNGCAYGVMSAKTCVYLCITSCQGRSSSVLHGTGELFGTGFDPISITYFFLFLSSKKKRRY